MPKADDMPYSRDTDTAIPMEEETSLGPPTSFPYTHFEVSTNETKNVWNSAWQEVFSQAALHSPKAKEVFTWGVCIST